MTTVRVVVSEPDSADVVLGDLHWHDGQVYAVRDVVYGGAPTTIAQYPTSDPAAMAPTTTTSLPAAWTTDGQAFNGPDAFAVAPDGSVFVRAPRNLGRYTPSSASGWGVARLRPDGTTDPTTPSSYPADFQGELGGTSRSLVMEPDGSGLLLGGIRQVSYGAGGTSYGIVARVPLPLPQDLQAGSQLLVSGSGYTPSDSSTRHDPPFPASPRVKASTEPFLDAVLDVDAKGPYLYVNENGYDIHRVDRRTDSIVSICCKYAGGFDKPVPVEGALATATHFDIVAGPVADRLGSVFFANRRGADVSIWQIRPDGTIHRVAGGGTTPPADGVTASDLRLSSIGDLDLDPDGNLYLTTGAQVLELPAVAAADTAPDAPVGLAATPGVGTLELSWSAPADDGGQPVTGYTVRIHPTGVAGDSQDQVTTVTTRSTTITGLVQGASYDVGVAATNSRGTGPAATSKATASAYTARLTATPATAAAGAPVTLDATTSTVPEGSTFEFFCDVRFNVPAPATDRTATCTYPRGSNDAGYGATVVVTGPDDATWHATTPVLVTDPSDTVEGSKAFNPVSPELGVTVEQNGSLSHSETRAGARIVLAAAVGTFREGSVVRIHQGDQAKLGDELGGGVTAHGGFAVTWTDTSGQKYDLTQPLVVTVTPEPAAALRAAQRRAGWDIGAAFQQWGQSFTQGVTSVVGTIGSALEFVGSKISQLWASAAQSLATPNKSRTNDVHTCSSFLIVTGANSYRCEGVLTTIKGVLTDRIAAVDAGGRVVSAGGANVVSAGGANVVSAGGANVVSAGGANVQVTLAANSVISAGGANVVSAGGANVVSAGGANVVSAGGANVVSAGGANVVSAGGANLTGGRVATLMVLTRDPGFAFAEPVDPTPPTTTLELDPAPPASGVYPHGTVVTARLLGTPADGKQVQRLGYEVTGDQVEAYTIVAGDEAEVELAGTGTSTLTYEAVDDQGVSSGPATLVVRIAAAPTDPGPIDPGPVDPDPVEPGPVDPGPVDPGPIDPDPVDPDPVDQAISLSAPSALTYGDADSPVSATATSGLPVVLRSLTEDVCVLVPDLRVVGAGTCSIEATQPGDADWTAAPTVIHSLTVARAPLSVRATGARMLRSGSRPAVAADYDGLVAGDTPFDLDVAPVCLALVRQQRTQCSGAQGADYDVTFVDGPLRVRKRGATFASPPLVHARVDQVVDLRVRVDGAAGRRVSWEGELPDGVRAVRQGRGGQLRFTGSPSAVGTSQLRLTVVEDGREVAHQVLVLRSW